MNQMNFSLHFLIREGGGGGGRVRAKRSIKIYIF